MDNRWEHVQPIEISWYYHIAMGTNVALRTHSEVFKRKTTFFSEDQTVSSHTVLG